MQVHVGSVWECIDEDSEYFGRLCVVKYIDDNPDYNGEGTIELKYANGDYYTGKVRRFTPGITHKLRKERIGVNKTTREVLFEITTSRGTSLINVIKDYPVAATDEQIQKDYEEWRAEQLDQLEGGWSPWGQK